MTKLIYLTIGLQLVCWDSRAAVLYELDFAQPETGSYSVWGGSPVIVPSFGTMSDVMLFHARTNPNSDGISLNLADHAPSYTIEFDVLTQGLRNSLFAFMLYLSTPEPRIVDLHGGLNAIGVYQPFPYTDTAVQPFFDNVAYHFRVFTDFTNNRWQVSVDGMSVYDNVFNATDVQDLTFALRDWRGGAVDNPNILVGLDNIRVEVVPEPSACLLILLGLGMYRRRAILPARANPASAVDGGVAPQSNSGRH
jgi:hypothetical protein